MDINAALLRRLAARMQRHVAANEWDEVRQLDRKLFGLLAKLQQSPELCQQLKADLLALKQVHLAAMSACEQERQRLGQVLANYQNQREGINAYQQVELGGDK